MEKFTKLTGIAAHLPMINVDTDMIIPKQYLKTIKRTGLAKGLFYELRFDHDGQPKDGFVLDQPAYREAKILIAGPNFGCGSSREHAPWALLDFGFRCIIAPSFADIFYNNCFKNGILPIVLPQEEIDKLIDDAERRLAQGLLLRNEKAPLRPAALQRLDDSRVEITITEGRYHQVRRMFAALGNRVVTLHRQRIGGLTLDDRLRPGQWRALTPAERAAVLTGQPIR